MKWFMAPQKTLASGTISRYHLPNYIDIILGIRDLFEKWHQEGVPDAPDISGS